MTALYQTDDSLAREAAAFELVGVMGALLQTAEREDDGTVVIRLGSVSLPHVVSVFNRATANDPIAAGDVGIPVS